MYKKITFLFISIAIVIILGLNFVFAEGGQRNDRPGRPPLHSRGQSISKEIQNLLDIEKQNPTTPHNVQERYRSLTRLIWRMLKSGRHVTEILSRDEGKKIESLIRDGYLEQAARRVHDAIMKLESFPTVPPDFIDRQTPAAKRPEHPRVLQVSQFSSDSILRLNIHHMANKESFDNILKLMNPVIDSVNRRLYFSGSKSTFIGVIDLEKDELTETFDIGIPGGFLLLDPKTNDIYMFDIGIKRFYKINVQKKKATEVPSLPPYLSLPKRQATKSFRGNTYKETGYPFKVGYLQGENASYGVIKINDASGKYIGQIKHGPEGLYFAIDQKTDKLYATNTGDGSISVFDLKNRGRKLKDIDVGTTADEIILNLKTGGLYIRDRLGGSTIFYYDQNIRTLATIPNENTAGSQGIGMWPARIIYDDGKLYVLSHYGGRIDVIDTTNNKPIGRIPLNLSYKPRTDGIPTMVMDKTRKILYAAFPELGEIAIASAKTLEPMRTLKIKEYDATRINPRRIVLSFDESLNRLFAYLTFEKKLHVYDGTTFALEKSISLDYRRMRPFMKSNSEKGVLYVGNRILDANSLEIIGRFPRGERVIAFENTKNTVYLAETSSLGPLKKIEKVYEFKDLALKKEWTLSPIFSIPSSFAFDFSSNKFYVAYFESAVVEAFDLATGEAPTSGTGVNSFHGGFRKGAERD
jgi:DNA-binding beta-propeller fold protein YncE